MNMFFRRFKVDHLGSFTDGVKIQWLPKLLQCFVLLALVQYLKKSL